MSREAAVTFLGAALLVALATGVAAQPAPASMNDLLMHRMDEQQTHSEREFDELRSRVDKLDAQADANSLKLAELQGQARVWGTVLTLLSSGSLVWTGLKHRADEKKKKQEEEQ
jgi:hypothetical protein